MKAFIGFWLLVLASTLTFDVDAATCAEANADGFLYLSVTPLAECSGHVLMDSTEYSQVPTLQALFAWPESDQMVKAWMAGFTLPMVCYLAAWGFGVVVNFFNSDKERY